MPATLAYKSIEDYLGPSEHRFFGSGYRRADHRIVGPIVAPPDEPGARATVTVAYPRDWSRKSSADLLPHLSSVDMILLAAQLAEAHLVQAHGLDAAARSRMWLRKVTLRASTTPQEDLVAMPASATLRRMTPLVEAPGLFVSVYDCTVGVMRARCEIEHELAPSAPRRRQAPADVASPGDVLGPDTCRYFGGAFKRRSQSVTDVCVDMGSLRADADVLISAFADGEAATEGIEGAYQPSVSMIDCFVVTLQMAQVLLYELDAVPREASNTLWMLGTVLVADRPQRPCGGPLAAHAAIAGKHLLEVRGGTWRNVDIVGGCAGIGLRACFAHELPHSAVAAAAAAAPA